MIKPEYVSEFGTSMQTGPRLASPPNGGTGASTGPIYAGDTANTPTQATSESTGATDLGSVLDAIRKLAPGADQQTNGELTDHLLAMCTSDSKATELATAAQETSRAAEAAEESMLRRYPMLNVQALAVDVISPTAKRFGHSEAASGTPTDTLHAWNRIETLVRGKYDQKDDEVRQESQAQIEKNLQARRESIQRIDAIDYFFLFPGNLDKFQTWTLRNSRRVSGRIRTFPRGKTGMPSPRRLHHSSPTQSLSRGGFDFTPMQTRSRSLQRLIYIERMGRQIDEGVKSLKRPGRDEENKKRAAASHRRKPNSAQVYRKRTRCIRLEGFVLGYVYT